HHPGTEQVGRRPQSEDDTGAARLRARRDARRARAGAAVRTRTEVLDVVRPRAGRKAGEGGDADSAGRDGPAGPRRERHETRRAHSLGWKQGRNGPHFPGDRSPVSRGLHGRLPRHVQAREDQQGQPGHSRGDGGLAGAEARHAGGGEVTLNYLPFSTYTAAAAVAPMLCFARPTVSEIGPSNGSRSTSLRVAPGTIPRFLR